MLQHCCSMLQRRRLDHYFSALGLSANCQLDRCGSLKQWMCKARQMLSPYVITVCCIVSKYRGMCLQFILQWTNFFFCVPGDRVQNNLTLKLYGQFHQWHADVSQTWKEIIHHPFCFSWCTSSAPGRNYSSIGDRLGRVRPTRLQQPSGGRKDPELFLMGCRHRFASPGNPDRLWYWKHGRAGPQIDDCEFYKSAYVCYVLCDFCCSWLQSPLFHLTLALRRIVMYMIRLWYCIWIQ